MDVIWLTNKCLSFQFQNAKIFNFLTSFTNVFCAQCIGFHTHTHTHTYYYYWFVVTIFPCFELVRRATSHETHWTVSHVPLLMRIRRLGLRSISAQNQTSNYEKFNLLWKKQNWNLLLWNIDFFRTKFHANYKWPESFHIICSESDKKSLPI